MLLCNHIAIVQIINFPLGGGSKICEVGREFNTEIHVVGHHKVLILVKPSPNIKDLESYLQLTRQCGDSRGHRRFVGIYEQYGWRFISRRLQDLNLADFLHADC